MEIKFETRHALFIILGILLMPLGGVLVKAKDFAASAKEAGASIKNQDLFSHNSVWRS